MTTTDWLIDIGLILIVLRQLREERLTWRFVAIPAVLVYITAKNYLHAIPTVGNDVLLVALCVAVGSALGLAGGLLTKVRVRDGVPFVRAGVAAASLWVGSMTVRLLFIVWITHSWGEGILARFSVDHHISGATVWSSALVLLALSEVAVRLGTIVFRGWVVTERAKAERATGISARIS